MANPVLSHPRFHDEAAAFEWVERIVWPAGPVCPHCGATTEHVGKLLNQRTKVSKKNPEGKPIHGLYKCYACRKAFTVRIGTIFEDSHAPMTLWMQAMYLLCSSKKGISANQLSRTLGVHLKTAWHMNHRIRLAMEDNGSGPLGGADLFLEADETFIGGKEGNKHVGKRGKRGAQGKAAVVALVERKGRVRSFNVPDVTAKTLKEVIAKHADRESHLRTDEARSYKEIGAEFASHETVTHSIEEYVRGDAYTNTAENFFSILKRGIYGCYFHVSETHLHRYLAEFDFRYSNRIALDVDDEERTDRLIRGIVGKRLTYRETVNETETPGT